MKTLILLALASSILSCSRCSSPGPNTYLRVGRDSVRVLSVVQREFQDGSPAAMHFSYETKYPTADTSAIRREAYALWSTVQPLVERQGLQAAILTANATTHRSEVGIAHESRGALRGFAIRKDAQGRWHHKGTVLSGLGSG